MAVNFLRFEIGSKALGDFACGTDQYNFLIIGEGHSHVGNVFEVVGWNVQRSGDAGGLEGQAASHVNDYWFLAFLKQCFEGVDINFGSIFDAFTADCLYSVGLNGKTKEFGAIFLQVGEIPFDATQAMKTAL